MVDLHFYGCMDIIFHKYTDIVLKIVVNKDEIFCGNIEHVDVPDGMVVIIRKLGAVLHHIEHC